MERPVRWEMVPARRWGRDHLRSRSRGANSRCSPSVTGFSRCSTRLKAPNYHPPRSLSRATFGAGFHVEQDHGWSGVDITGWPLFSVHFAVPYGFRSTTSTRRNRSFKGAALRRPKSFDFGTPRRPLRPPGLVCTTHSAFRLIGTLAVTALLATFSHVRPSSPPEATKTPRHSTRRL